MSNKVLVFAPAAFNLAATTRMIEHDGRLCGQAGCGGGHAAAFAKVMEKWDGPKLAAERLYQQFGS